MTAEVHVSSPLVGHAATDEILERIEAMTPDLQRVAGAEEEAGVLCRETVEALDEAGVFLASTPHEYGGHALQTYQQRRIITAVGAIAGSTGWVTGVTATHARMLAMFSKEVQDEIFGMDWVGPRMSGVFRENGPGLARAVDGGYMLSGTWAFCSGSAHTAWSMLGARRVDDEDGELLLTMVPEAQLERLDDWHVVGMKATGSCSVRISEEVFVPAHRTLGLVAALFGNWASEPPEDQPLFRNDFMAHNALLGGAGPVGLAKGALEHFTSRMDGRGITFTDYKVQSHAPVTHFQLAEVVHRIDAAELALGSAAADIDRRAYFREPFDVLARAKIKFEAAAAVRDAADAVGIIQSASGASSVVDSNPIQRFARDVRVATLHATLNYLSCAEDYGRLLAGRPGFNPFG